MTMKNGEPMSTSAERRASAKLQRLWRTLRAERPVAMDPATITKAAENDDKRSIPARLAISLAAVLVVLAIGLAGIVWRPWGASLGLGSASPASIHFRAPTYSFDYPAGWRTLSSPFDETFVVRVDAIIGTGAWKTGCTVTDSGEACTGDAVDVSAGRIVVKVWRRIDGPGQLCVGADQANATLGPNAVQETHTGSVTVWEIRRPANEFGWMNNVYVEVWADGPSQVDSARELVASFRWDASLASSEPSCGATRTP
jgi:hypothetical protein